MAGAKFDELMGKYGVSRQESAQPVSQQKQSTVNVKDFATQAVQLGTAGPLDELMAKYWTPSEPGKVTSLTPEGKKYYQDLARARSSVMAYDQDGKLNAWQTALNMVQDAKNYAGAYGKTKAYAEGRGAEYDQRAALQAERDRLQAEYDKIYVGAYDIPAAKRKQDLKDQIDAIDAQLNPALTAEEVKQQYGLDYDLEEMPFLSKLLGHPIYKPAKGVSAAEVNGLPEGSGLTEVANAVREKPGAITSFKEHYLTDNGPTGDPTLDNWGENLQMNAESARQLAETYQIPTAALEGGFTAENINAFEQNYADKSYEQKLGTNLARTAINYGLDFMNAGLTAADAISLGKLSGGTGTASSIFQAANFLQNAGSGISAQAYEAMRSNLNWLQKVTLDLETTLGEQLLDRFIGGNASKIGGLLPMGVRVFGSGAQEAENRGESLGQQLKTGGGRAGVEVATELLGGVGGSWRGTGYGDAFFGKLDKWVAGKTGSELLGTIINAFGSEATEEMLADILNPLIDRIFGIGEVTGRGEDKAFMQKLGDFLTDVWGDGQLLYDGMLGGLAGGVGGGFTQVGYSAGARNLAVDVATYKAAQRIAGSNSMRSKFTELTGVKLDSSEEKAILQIATYLTNVSDTAEGSPNARTIETNLSRGKTTGVEQRSAELGAAGVQGKTLTRQIDSVFRSQGVELDEMGKAALTDGYVPSVSSVDTYVYGTLEAYQLGELGLSLEQALGESSYAGELQPEQFRHAWELGAKKASGAPLTEEEFFKRFGEDAEAVKEAYQGRAEGVKLEEFAPAYMASYNAGRSGVKLEDARSAESRTSKLSEKELQAAWELGSKADVRDTATRMEAVKSKGKTVTGAGTVRAETGVRFTDMNSAQRTAVRALRFIAKVTGVNIVLYDGTKGGTVTDETGRKYFTSDNGYFDPSTNTIHIDISAGVNTEEDVGQVGKYTMLRTFAHEYTHFIEHNAADRYRELRTAVFARMSENGQNPVELIEQKMAEDSKLSYDAAAREVVADAMTDMLEDSTFAQTLARENRSLFDSIREQLRAFVSRLRAAFRTMNPNEDLGAKALKENVNGTLRYFEDIQKMWDNSALEAARNARGTESAAESAPAETEAVAAEAAIEETVPEDNSIIGASETITDVTEAVQHSYRSLAQAAGFTAVRGEDGERYWIRNGERAGKVSVDDIRHSPIGAMITASIRSDAFPQGISKSDAEKQILFFTKICNMAATTGDFAMVMKFAGSAAFTAMKANSDVQYGTTYDFPSICTKTQAMIDAMSAYMVKHGRGMNREEIIDLYRRVFASGNPVPCPECYVFSRWIGIGGLLDNMKKYQDTYCRMTPDDVRAEYRKLEAEVNAFAEEHNLSFGKAKGKLAERYEKLRLKIEKADNQGVKVKESDRRLLEELEPQHTTLKAMTWIRDVYFGGNLNAKEMNPRAEVPVDVLFDLNAGDAFATKYQEAWDFRTTQGAGYGKAITPYAEAVIGEGIMITNSQKFIDQKKEYARETGEVIDNPFLHPNPDGTLSKKAMKALQDARKKMKAQNFRGGQRYSSTSDARPDTYSDFLLAALETQAMQGMVQVYTKVTGAVDAYNDWGFSSNMSLMPMFGGLDADGYIIDTPVGGMNPNTASTLRERDELAGTITIGVNDEHIRKMMRDGETKDTRGRIIKVIRDFIIPYHASGGQAETVDLMRQIQEGEKKGNKVHSTDYTRTQGDKILSDEALRNVGQVLWGRQLTDEDIELIHRRRAARIAILCGKANIDMDVVRGSRFLSALYDKFNGGEWTGVTNPKAKVEHQIYPNEFWDKSVTYENSGKITRDYLEYCEELGFLHRFSGRTINSKSGLSWSSGYDKNGKPIKLTDLAYEADEDGMPTDKVNDFFWKVLTDRRMYGADGRYLEQRIANLTVTPTSIMPSTKLKVGEFAKAVDESREYDKAISDKLVEEIRNGEIQRSMRVVPPAVPKSNQWQSGHSEAWFRENGFPIREDVSEDWMKARMAKGWREGKKPYSEKGFSGAQKREGTQIDSTESTYVKIFNYLRGKYPDTYKTLRILDASSGLGLGTKAGLEMGFDVTDIEPYVHPDSDYFPDYMDYSSLQAKVESGEVKPFDFIISNAVLNVIPQDTRDNMVDWFGSVLAPGGQLYVNTLDANYTKNTTADIQRNKAGDITGKVLTQSGDYVTPGAKRGNEIYVAGSRSVQKGFSNDELRAYLKDALGNGYIAEAPEFKAGSGATAIVTKVDNTQHSRRALTQKEQKYYDTNQKRTTVGQNLYTLQGQPTGRYKGNVGKMIQGDVGKQIYLHKNYATEVIPEDVYKKALKILKNKHPGFDFNCLMYEAEKNQIRFDEAPDFDTAREPIAGDTVTVNYATGETKTGHSEKIWHHKWEWVKNDYTGFNVEDSWNWSKRYLSALRKVDTSEHVFEYKFNQRGIANGTSNGYDAWNEQLEYFDLPTDTVQHQRRTTTYSNLEVLEMAADKVETKDPAVQEALTTFKKHIDNVRTMQGQMADLDDQISVADPDEEKELVKKREALSRKLLNERNAMLKLERTSVLRRILVQARDVIEKEERSKLLEYKEQRDERDAANKYREYVQKKAKKLYEMLMTNSNDLHVPEVLKAPLGEFLESLDFTSKRQLAGGAETKADEKFGARLLRLQQMLENQQRYIDGDGSVQSDLGGYVDVSEEVLQELREMAEKITQELNMGMTFTVNQMTGEQLKTMSKFLSNLRTAINNMNRLMANARFTDVREMSSADIDAMKELGKAKPLANSGAAGFTVWENGVPYYVFKRFGKGGESIFDGFTRGWEKMAMNGQEIIDFAEKAYTTKEVNEWKSKIHEIQLEDGSKIQMTTAQIMSFAMLLGREQAMKHIGKGGIRIGDITRKGKAGKISDTTHYHLSGADIEKITGLLSARQMAVAQAMQKFMAKKGAQWGNEISMRRFGYNFYTEGENYFPIETDSNDRPMADTDLQKNSMFRLLNLGSSKSLNPKASNALVIGDIFDVFADHMSDMAKLNGMGLPILDAIKWFNYKERIDRSDGTYDTRTLQGAMQQAYGDYAGRYFRTLMKDINGQTETGDRGMGVAGWFISRYKAAAVGANLRVAMLQPTSYVRAMTVVKPQYLLGAFAHRNAYEEAMKYSGTAVWKSLGFYETDMARSMREQIQHNEGLHDKLVEASMKLAELGDRLTWGRLWVACKMQTKAQNPGLSSEALNKKTADLFREAIYSSQVMDSTLTRSEIMRSKGVYSKLSSAFMAEPTLSYNILLDAASQYSLDERRYGKAKAWQKNAGHIGRAFIVYVNSAAVAAIVESLADAARDDDDEPYWDKVLQALLGEDGKLWKGNLAQDLTIIGKLPYIKDFVSKIQGYASGNLSVSAFNTLVDAINIWTETYKLSTGQLEKPTKITGYGKMTDWGKVYKSLQAVSQLSGLAVSNMTRDAVALWNTIMNGRKDEWKIRTYESSNTEKAANLIKAIESGDAEMIQARMQAFESEKDAASAAKTYIKDMFSSGEITEEKAMELLAHFGVTGNDAYWKIRSWEDEDKYSEIKTAVLSGDSAAYRSEMSQLTSHGVKEKDVQSTIRSFVRSVYFGNDLSDKEAEILGGRTLSDEQVRRILANYGGMSVDDAVRTVNEWRENKAFTAKYGPEYESYGLTITQAKYYYGTVRNITTLQTYAKQVDSYGLDTVKAYYGDGTDNWRSTGLSIEQYSSYKTAKSQCKGTDANGDGKADRYSKKNQILEVINALPVSSEVKDAIYRKEGYAEGNLRTAPWHK